MAELLEGFYVTPEPTIEELRERYLRPAAEAIKRMVREGKSADEIERLTGLRMNQAAMELWRRG